MKRKFCCDASRDMYENYYASQSGGELPVFVGARYQRRHGIGSILSGLFRRVLPFLKANARNLATNVLKTGVDIADDVLGQGKKLSESVKERIPQGIKRTVQELNWQTGSGSVKKRRKDGIRRRQIL